MIDNTRILQMAFKFITGSIANVTKYDNEDEKGFNVWDFALTKSKIPGIKPVKLYYRNSLILEIDQGDDYLAASQLYNTMATAYHNIESTKKEQLINEIEKKYGYLVKEKTKNSSPGS